MATNSLDVALARLRRQIIEAEGYPLGDPESPAAMNADYICGMVHAFVYQGFPDIGEPEVLAGMQSLTTVNIKQFLIRHGFDDWFDD